MERQGRNWVDSMSDEDILKRTFNSGELLITNENNSPLIKQAKELLLSDYLVTAKFTYNNYNGETLYCNGRVLASRKTKGSPIKLTKGVRLLEGTPLKASGSNKYPTVRFKEGYCVLEFISNGLPIIDRVNGWSIDIITIKSLH